MKIISLASNYRSHQSILDASFKMIEQNYDEDEYKDLRVKLKSGKGEEAKPLDIIEAADIYTEESYLLKKLKSIIKEEPQNTAAIIVRRNSDAAKIFSLLEKNNIPASAERGANIFSHPLGVIFFSLLEFLSDPSKTESLAQTFAGGLWGLDFGKQTELIKLARSGNMEEISKKLPLISKLKKEMVSSGVMTYLALAADTSGFTALASKTPLGVEIWRGIFALAGELARANDIEDTSTLIEELLAYKKSAEKRSIKIKTGKSDAKISIMTAHGSKGLEFDYVFLPYAVEETWINKNRASFFVMPKEKEEGDNIRDERRLFYVSLTRARKHVSVSFSLEDDTGKLLTPLRFLDELDSLHVSKTNLKKIERTHISQNMEKISSQRNNEQIEYAKRELLENGLSVTSLNCFVNCPSEFLYKSILKLPEPPIASSEKGNAMHEAIANVWKNPTRQGGINIKEIEQIIISSVTDYFRRSLLPVFEKEAILEELVSNAPIVARALLEHFNQTGSVSVEKWVEMTFVKENIELALHGRIDAIVESDNDLRVYEYKTREAMSIPAIKGETKSSERTNGGNYFRQLIFYKMLLGGANKNIEPAIVFLKPDSKGRCPVIPIEVEKSDTERVKEEINSLIESVWSGRILTDTCNDPLCKYCGWKKLR